jgi:uncharacterized protein YgiM (DUF1202 family)
MTVSKIKSLSFIIMFSFLVYGSCLAQEGYEDISKIGFIKNDGANVRAGDNVNFTSLCKLEDGDPVKVIGKRYSWYKILLPEKAHVYIKGDFVEIIPDQEEAGINASNVNLRAGPGTKYAIVGQVSKPDKIHIVAEEENAWYKITPPKNIAGWVHSSQLRFSTEKSAPEEEIKDKE